jgi:glycosyltransferase involved in cell wall biosynthesis
MSTVHDKHPLVAHRNGTAAPSVSSFAPESRSENFRWAVGFDGSFIPQLGIDAYQWTQHEQCWREDFERVRHDLNCTEAHYSIPWHKIETAPGVFDWSWTDERFAYAGKLGLNLVVGLIHSGVPTWLPQSFADADFPERFEFFAREFGKRYQGVITQVCVFHEPLNTALLAGEVGVLPPYGRGLPSYFTTLSRVVQATSRAITAMRETMPGVEIMITEAIGNEPELNTADVQQRTYKQFLALDLLWGHVTPAHALHTWLRGNGFPLSDLDWFCSHPQTVDIIGLDFYPQSEIQLKTTRGDSALHPQPEHLSDLYRNAHTCWERYSVPMLIAETGLSGDDAEKVWCLEHSVSEVRRLREEGIPVLGYAWSTLTDRIDWDSTMPEDSGRIYPVGIYRLERVSLDTLVRRPGALRDVYKTTIERGNLPVGEIATKQFVMEKRLNSIHPADLAERENLMENSILDGTKVLSSDKKASYSTLSYPIIVHCHLRWDFVWQRPQQFLSRLSKKHRILFAEGPLLVDEDITPYYTLKEAAGYPNITVMQSYFPSSRFQDGAWVDAERLRLLKEATSKELGGKFNDPVQWFYDPMAVCAYAGQMDEIATVYDCMDQLSQFKFAPPELIQREHELLVDHADVVFAGGRKMWEDKKKHNPNCHFYGCGVDVAHFSKARDESTALPEDLAAIQGPILGYFGVVDERLDYDLIAKLADENPNWSIAMVGPVVKVSESDLPRRQNIHWLGGRDYQQLPSYTKGFDVALMPFARNEATEYINPTKALEYMATGTPIVSSDVPDVVSNFAQVVKIATNHDEFIAMCRSALSQADEVAVERGLKMADANTWDAIVAKLEKHINDALANKSLLEQSDQKVASSAA